MLEIVIPFLVGAASSWYGSQVGGGGILFLSYLLWMGIPPQMAMGTHRSVILAGRFASTTKFIRSGQVPWKFLGPLMVLYMAGVYVGTQIFLTLSTSAVDIVVIIGLILPLLAIVFKKNIGEIDHKPSKILLGLGAVGMFFVSLWGGVMSAGAGVLALVVLSLFWGLSFVKAKALTTLAGIPSSIYATWFMFHHGFVDIQQFWPAAVGYLVGAWFGASFAIAKGNEWMKKLIVIVTLASLVKVIFF